MFVVELNWAGKKNEGGETATQKREKGKRRQDMRNRMFQPRQTHPSYSCSMRNRIPSGVLHSHMSGGHGTLHVPASRVLSVEVLTEPWLVTWRPGGAGAIIGQVEFSALWISPFRTALEACHWSSFDEFADASQALHLKILLFANDYLSEIHSLGSCGVY